MLVQISQGDYSGGRQKPEAYLDLEKGEMISGTDAYATAANKFPRSAQPAAAPSSP